MGFNHGHVLHYQWCGLNYYSKLHYWMIIKFSVVTRLMLHWVLLSVVLFCVQRKVLNDEWCGQVVLSIRMPRTGRVAPLSDSERIQFFHYFYSRRNTQWLTSLDASTSTQWLTSLDASVERDWSRLISVLPHYGWRRLTPVRPQCDWFLLTKCCHAVTDVACRQCFLTVTDVSWRKCFPALLRIARHSRFVR